MQRCKYLDDLGLDIEQYGTNFTQGDDEKNKKWEEERKEYGFDSRETWCLDRIFIEWIYTRVMMFKERNNINTDINKFTYKGEVMTQTEGIDKILELSKQILLKKDEIYTNADDYNLFLENSREICDIWKEILPHMGW